MCCYLMSQVEVDCLTGEWNLLRTDILMDVGASLNPGLDIGQIEGAFIQGLGWYVGIHTFFHCFVKYPRTYLVHVYGDYFYILYTGVWTCHVYDCRCTMEELVWGDAAHGWVRPGFLFTRGPGTYKIPTSSGISIFCNVSHIMLHKNI